MCRRRRFFCRHPIYPPPSPLVALYPLAFKLRGVRRASGDGLPILVLLLNRIPFLYTPIVPTTENHTVALDAQKQRLDVQDLSYLDLRALRAAASFSQRLVARGSLLRFADFSDSAHRGADFRGADLCGADFSRSDLTEADFTGANLEGARFHGAELARANFTSSILIGANFSSTDVSGAIFALADIRGATFRRARYHAIPQHYPRGLDTAIISRTAMPERFWRFVKGALPDDCSSRSGTPRQKRAADVTARRYWARKRAPDMLSNIRIQELVGCEIDRSNYQHYVREYRRLCGTADWLPTRKAGSALSDVVDDPRHSEICRKAMLLAQDKIRTENAWRRSRELARQQAGE